MDFFTYYCKPIKLILPESNSSIRRMIANTIEVMNGCHTRFKNIMAEAESSQLV